MLRPRRSQSPRAPVPASAWWSSPSPTWPRLRETTEPAAERPVAPVHDIDDDLAPPPPVAGPPTEGEPHTEAEDPDATVEHDALWSEPESRRDRGADG